MNLVTRRTLLTSAFAAALAATGCQQPSGGKTSGGGTGSASASKTVPKDATRVAESASGRLIHRAQRPGSIWVQDGATGDVVYTGQVRADSNVVVDTRADAVTVNDIQVRHAPKLNPDHRYKLYFRY